MALIYTAGWDFAIIGTASCTLTDDSVTDAPVSFSSGTHAHITMESIMGSGTYTAFPTVFAAALTATASTHTYSGSFSTSTMKYTIDNDDSSNFTLTFASTTPAILLRRILGFSATQTGASVYSSDQRPYYALAALQGSTAFGSVNTGGRTDDSGDYEPGGIAYMDEADSGATYLIARTAAPVYANWSQAMESYEATHAHKASATVPWTYDHLFSHLRSGNFPFGLTDTTISPSTFEVYRLRGDGASFHPTREVANTSALWRVPFRCTLVGRS